MLRSLIDAMEGATLSSRVGVLESCCEVVGSSTAQLRSRIDILESCCERASSRIENLESCCEEVKTDTCFCAKCVIHITTPVFCTPAMLPTLADNPAVTVFRFEPCWDDEHMPRLIFDASNFIGGVVDLVKDARVIFQGEGIVEVRNGITFNFGNEPLTADWPHIVVEQRAMMEPAAGATIGFTGLGKFKVRDAGMLNVDLASQVIFGLTTDDQFKVDVDATGAIIVNNSSALVTFQLGTFDVHFSRSALMSILDGRVEFNSNNDLYAPGILSSLYFQQGANLEVQWPSGLLRLSPNFDNSLTDFDNRTGVVDGGGDKDYGYGKMQFINYLTGIDTTVRLEPNNFQMEDTIVELFLELGLLLKSDQPIQSPSDINILVRLGDDHRTLAAIDPRRTGRVFALQDLDHDVAYQRVDFSGQGFFPIIGRDFNGNQFFIDENGNRTIITTVL